MIARAPSMALTAFTTQDGVEILKFPDDVREALREAWGEIAREEGVRDYLFKEVLEDIETFQTGGEVKNEAEGEASGVAEADADEPMPPAPPPGDATPVGP